MPRRTALALALLLAPSLAAAQAWTLEPGEAAFRLTQHFVSASTWTDHAGSDQAFDSLALATPFLDRSLVLYGEVGLAPSLTLFGAVPLRRITIVEGGPEEVERRAVDFGTATLGLRVGLERALEMLGLEDGRNALAANASLGLPLGYRRNVVPAVGSGQVDAELLLVFARRFEPAYAQAALGYRYRSAVFELSRVVACPPAPEAEAATVCVPASGAEISFGNQLLARLEGGYAWREAVRARGLLDVAWSTAEPEAVAPFGGSLQPELFPYQRTVRAGFGLTLHALGELGLSVDVLAPVYARNALKAAEITIGLEMGLW